MGSLLELHPAVTNAPGALAQLGLNRADLDTTIQSLEALRDEHAAEAAAVPPCPPWCDSRHARDDADNWVHVSVTHMVTLGDDSLTLRLLHDSKTDTPLVEISYDDDTPFYLDLTSTAELATILNILGVYAKGDWAGPPEAGNEDAALERLYSTPF